MKITLEQNLHNFKRMWRYFSLLKKAVFAYTFIKLVLVFIKIILFFLLDSCSSKFKNHANITLTFLRAHLHTLSLKVILCFQSNYEMYHEMPLALTFYAGNTSYITINQNAKAFWDTRFMQRRCTCVKRECVA